MNYTVAFYLVDRAYGGPEEGGWYYDYGVPVDELSRFTRGFRSEEEAFKYLEKLNQRVAPILNKGRREISSVLSEGRYYAEISEGNPQPWPKERPSYS